MFKICINNYFILITRKRSIGLPVSLSDYQTLEYSNNRYRSVPIYNKMNLF